MKKRRIFIIGLIVLLLACPSCMIYITVKQQDGYKKRAANNMNEYMLQFLTMAVEAKTDPDYKPLSFNGLDEKSQEGATATMNEIFKTILDMEQNDDGFHYEAYNEKTRQYYKNQKSYYPIAYRGFFKSSSHSKYFYTDAVSLFDESDIVRQLDERYKLDEGKDGKRSLLKVNNTYVDLNQVSINLPQNTEMTYYCTTYVSPMTYIDINFVSEYDVAVLSGVALILGLVIFIYILMNSLEVEETINPYRTIKQWKLLTVIIIIGLTSSIFIGASGMTGYFVMMGELQSVLARCGVTYATPISYGLYFFCMLIFYFLFSMLCFTVKYMFMNGMDYFRNNTCIYALYAKLKGLGNKITEFDLRDNVNQDILKFTICNALLVIILYVISPSKTIFAILYVIISFFVYKKAVNEGKK